MTSPAPHRKSFRIHLSTACVLMLAGAAVLWVNVQLTYDLTGEGSASSDKSKVTYGRSFVTYHAGWPAVCFSKKVTTSERFYQYDATISDKEFVADAEHLNLWEAVKLKDGSSTFLAGWFALDIACGLLILGFCAVLCESWTRWRQRCTQKAGLSASSASF